MILKKRLAKDIVTIFYNKQLSDSAEEQFTKVIQKKEVPEEIPEYILPGSPGTIYDLLVWTGLAKSNSEAKRLVSQGAVELDGSRVTSDEHTVKVSHGSVIKVGKRRFARLVDTNK
jgi:tyrosyl-tRNA synthetase